MRTHQAPLKVPFSEKLKSLPEFIGLRVNQEPNYVELRREGEIEIRRYDSMVLASVQVMGDFEDASEEGFERLARYIFGDNAEALQLPMTAPVFQEEGAESWTLSFVLPEGLAAHEAPRPLDAEIRISEVPPRTMAVLRYAGSNDENDRGHAASALRTWLSASRTPVASSVRWAQYDPPFAIPFFRRNEVQVDLAL